VAGVVLVALQLIVPAVTSGTGLDASTGPGWGRALAHLGVGALAELLRSQRRQLPAYLRVAAAVLVLIAVAAVLWFSWWR
jgi:hypothetical protein